jgi:NADH-quinone oxidoreductase subunit L
MGNLNATLGQVAHAVLLLPLLSFVLNGLWLGRRHPRASAWTATALMGATLACAGVVAMGYRAQVLAHPEIFPGKTAVVWEHLWMNMGTGTVNLAAKLGFYLDPISVMMILVVAFISFLVNVYSIGYMKGDRGAGRFFPILSFFSFSMLGLVASSNLAQTFFFWELVGAASYLLIGFWYEKPSAVAAAKKAFIVTRCADAFFLLGFLLVGLHAGSFDFTVVNSPEAAASLSRTLSLGLFSANLLGLATVFVYLGAWGKSAMFPFHVWLPDAMEGPTPVSSLIHSATMVVAGVYLTARLFPLFSAAPGTLRIVEVTGAFTAVFAAVIACSQTDLKRILAFSTLSQLGLMMAALGTAAAAGYSASMFHIFTHAFFKCLLFLSAGVVIHAIHSNDIRDAGGLRRALPLTYAGTLIAWLAISGLWPLSGFFSKEEILHAAWNGGHRSAFLAVLATGGLTAFYMSRYFFLVFHGGPRAERKHAPHESLIMALPILVLALPSAMAGWRSRETFVSHVLPWTSVGSPAAAGSAGVELAWLPWVTSALALAGVGLGWFFYAGGRVKPGLGEKSSVWHRLLFNKFYVDELYLGVVRAGTKIVAAPSSWIERNIINGLFDAVAAVLRGVARVQSRFQSGQVQWYMGVALLGLYLLYRWGRGPQ